MVSFIHSFSAYSQKADTKPRDTQWRAENKRVRLFTTGCHTRGKLLTWVFSRQLVSVQIPEWSTEFSWEGWVMQSIAVHKLCQTQKLPSQVCTLRGGKLLCILRRHRHGPCRSVIKNRSRPLTVIMTVLRGGSYSRFLTQSRSYISQKFEKKSSSKLYKIRLFPVLSWNLLVCHNFQPGLITPILNWGYLLIYFFNAGNQWS
jgi:hypothetical protein